MAANVGPVVVGTDFSEGSAVALQEARRLAALMGAGLIVVHVVDGVQTAGWEAAGPVAGWLVSAGLEPNDLVVRFGRAWVELARYAGEVGPSLVVVGSHGASGYQPLDIGSTASRLSLHARCPVAVISPRSGAVEAVTRQETRRNVAGRADATAVARAEPGDQQLTGETR